MINEVSDRKLSFLEYAVFPRIGTPALIFIYLFMNGGWPHSRVTSLVIPANIIQSI